MRLAVAIAVALGGGCGSEGSGATDFEISMSLMFSQGPQCSRTALTGLNAVMHVGGFDESCSLDVDLVTMRTSGRCEGILVGVERPVIIVHSLPGPNGGPLYFAQGVADLREVSLPPGEAPVVTVDITGVKSTQAEVDRMAPPTCSRVALGRERTFDEWTWCFLSNQRMRFDCNGAGTTNLVEVCNSMPLSCN